jgi:hypothetical protein
LKKLLILALFLLISSMLLSAFPTFLGLTAAESAKFKISGYLVDSNGRGIGGANIIFNVPSIVPSVYSDNSGYYEIFAPTGTYHINVWPPYDSNYIDYDEPGFVVQSDVTKNITMYSGYKVSGYISDSSGMPVTGAVVFLNNYGSGWFSNNRGYYFLSVPAGTYKIDAHPRIGTYSSPTTNFPTYYEYNFVVNSNTIKNITVSSATPTPSPASTPTPIPTPTQNPTPTPTPTPNLPATFVSISTDASSYQVGSTLNVKGRLCDQSGNPLSDKTVILSYAIDNSPSWFQIGSGKTNSAGEYSIQWLIEASGTFNIKAEWAGNANYLGSRNYTTLCFLPYQDKKVFFVESNSTVTGLDFNSNSLMLSFSVSGPSGTKGYTKATIAKTLAPNFTGTTVSLDGKELNFTVSSSNDYWIVAFNYSHSTHQISINLPKDAKGNLTPTSPSPEFPSWFALAFVVVLTTLIAFAFVRKKLTPPHKTD